MEVCLIPDDYVLDGDPTPPPQKGGGAPKVSTHVYCGQTAGWIKMVLVTEVGLCPGVCVRWVPARLCKKGAEPQFSAHVYCGQTAAWIKMPLGTTDVGLGPDDIVSDGDPAPSPKRGRSPQFSALVYCGHWPNGWMDEDGTWHGGRPWSSLHCARWGHSSPPQKRGQSPPIFGPSLLWPEGWMHQGATWYGDRPQPRRLFVRCRVGDPAPSQKGAGPLNFRPMTVVAIR